VITIVSDASMQKDKHSGFAWVIAHQDIKLWTGVGLSPGAVEDMHSGQAKAFGMLAALLFMQHYVNSYGPEQFTTRLLQCFCNILGLITNTMTMLSQTIVRPNDATNDDRDVYLAIVMAVQECKPFMAGFFHIRGHQDKDPKCHLTIM